MTANEPQYISTFTSILKEQFSVASIGFTQAHSAFPLVLATKTVVARIAQS